MGMYKQSSNSKGSLKNIQVLVNDFPNVINKKINDLLGTDDNIMWVSPLRNEYYAEYRDAEFLRQLELDHLIPDLREFWPRNGPQWDGLAKSYEKVYLIEAKANLPELISPSSGAKAEKSIELIKTSLERTKKYISQTAIQADWTANYYQYTNRIAHLSFLRQKGINAYLVFLYFIGDKTVNGPDTIDEWVQAKKEMERVLELPVQHKLSDYILDVYVFINEIV